MTFTTWLENHEGFALLMVLLFGGGLLVLKFAIDDLKKWDRSGPAGSAQEPQQEAAQEPQAHPSAAPVDAAEWRSFAAKAIGFVTSVLALVVLYQVVRFWQGNVGAPGWDQLVSAMQSALGSADAQNPFVEWFQTVMNYAGGTIAWAGWATLVLAVGSTVARIVEVGLAQYRLECKHAAEAQERFEKMEARRERRRERMSARREGAAEKSSIALPLVLGILIGKIF